ncbi:DUF86 domain-containing protein [Candidatus Amarolinea aalborgensis]|uniref:HepT-like ribonuclease domain-containing protein n=1 Tax=Candidatus Amarolinea aalborgensis TaxID=2249329 RepID=UPI003BF9B49C
MHRNRRRSGRAGHVGMRHRLIHAYYSVDMDRVWDTITDDLPPLLATLESMIESLIPPPSVKTND